MFSFGKITFSGKNHVEFRWCAVRWTRWAHQTFTTTSFRKSSRFRTVADPGFRLNQPEHHRTFGGLWKHPERGGRLLVFRSTVGQRKIAKTKRRDGRKNAKHQLFLIMQGASFRNVWFRASLANIYRENKRIRDRAKMNPRTVWRLWATTGEGVDAGFFEGEKLELERVRSVWWGRSELNPEQNI